VTANAAAEILHGTDCRGDDERVNSIAQERENWTNKREINELDKQRATVATSICVAMTLNTQHANVRDEEQTVDVRLRSNYNFTIETRMEQLWKRIERHPSSLVTMHWQQLHRLIYCAVH